MNKNIVIGITVLLIGGIIFVMVVLGCDTS